jgi:hypothetical protein
MSTVNERHLGQYKSDKRSGKGTQYYADGSRYTGDWIDDQKMGEGIFSWPTGDRYEMRNLKMMSDGLCKRFYNT